jgi:4-carboxymuconolactone decarboxylase
MMFPKCAGLILFGVVLIPYGVGAARAQVTMPAAASEAPLPADVDPVSRNRLPLPTRADMANDEERKIFDEESVRASSSRLYSPEVAKALDDAHAYEKFNTALGSRLVQIAVLVTARELDNQFEWTQWEEHGLLSGQKSLVEPAIVETIKYCKPVVGLGPKETVIIKFGRELFGPQKKVSSQTFAETLRLFGRRTTVDLVELMVLYQATGTELNAFDGQLRPGQKPLLPPRSSIPLCQGA